MSSVTNFLRTTALLSIVTTVTSVTSWHTATKSNNSSTLIKKLTQPLNGVVGKQNDFRPRRDFKSNIKSHTIFEDDKITQTMLANNNKQFHDYLNPNFHPQNVFKCPPCVCKNISSNSVSVFCTDCCSLASIPQNWPVEIDEIIIDVNHRIRVLDLRTLLMYTSLKRFKMRAYGLRRVFSSSRLNVSSKLIYLGLFGNEISSIKENCFLDFPNLLKLSLRSNQIKNLTKEMFTGLRNLRYLSIARNNINFIANDTFDDMSNLVTLDISVNEIICTDIDHQLVRIFTPLSFLEQLYINNMCNRGTYQSRTYPNKALKVLTNLRMLCIDEIDKRGLGPEIKSLVHLTHLIIALSYFDTFTDESYFDNVPLITSLKILSSTLHIHPEAFAKLTNLINFTYSVNDFQNEKDLCKSLKDVKYLLNSSLKYLTLSGVNNLDTGCRKLEAQDGNYLQLLKLIELDLSDNNLVHLSQDFIELLPDTLKKIDLSRNRLSYRLVYSLNIFPENLIEINLSYQFIAGHRGEYINNQLNDKNKLQSNKSLTSKFERPTISFENESMETFEVSKLNLPPKLRILSADSFGRFGDPLWNLLNFQSNYSLRKVSLAGSGFKMWAGMEFLDSIETAVVSNNNADYFNIYCFKENNSLKHLAMSRNLFGPALRYDEDNLFFANAKQLKVLDMSQNFITIIAKDYFRNLVQLEILDISKNRINTINISFSHMSELRFLDLSSNSITSINKQSRSDLDLIAADHRVYLDLTSNPLPCTCEGLELMKWMAFTNVYLLNQDFLECRNDFDHVIEIGNIVQRVETLQRQCASKTVIILTCVFSIIIFGILLISSLMYRYRWKLRYLRSIALVKLLGARPTANNMIGYRFDAYILYTDDTRRFVLRDCVRELEEKRGHRLCIEDRDFLPGIYNVSQIVSSVQNSTKTVAMVTPEFYQGEYAEYSVKMALMEEIFMRRSVLFLCVREPTDDEDLSHDLLTAMKQNNYIEYPPRDDVTDEIIDEFWNQFSRAIGRNEREEI